MTAVVTVPVIGYRNVWKKKCSQKNICLEKTGYWLDWTCFG